MTATQVPFAREGHDFYQLDPRIPMLDATGCACGAEHFGRRTFCQWAMYHDGPEPEPEEAA